MHVYEIHICRGVHLIGVYFGVFRIFQFGFLGNALTPHRRMASLGIDKLSPAESSPLNI
jgi:hypothetical protein